MPQQRVHKSTLEKAKKLKDSMNEEREILGLKKLTTPDIYETAIEFMMNGHLEAKKLIKEQSK